MLERIDRVDDPRIGDYRDVRDADLSARGVFMAEGRQVVRVLFGASRFRPRSVLLTEAALGSLQDVIDARPEVPVFVAASDVMNRIVGFDIHRGCLAAGEVAVADPDDGDGVPSWMAGDPSEPALVVVLEGINNHDNIGGIFRNAAAFAARGCILDEDCVDPLYRKAIRVSMGASLLVPHARVARRADRYGFLRASGFRVLAATPAPDAVPLSQVAGGGRVAIVVGAERAGLDPASLAESDLRVQIPIDSAVDSLNVATATGILLHHLRTSIPR